MKNNKLDNFKTPIIIIIVLAFVLGLIFSNNGSINVFKHSNVLNILSSYENADLEDSIKQYAKKNNIELEFTYMGDLEIVTELNENSKNYDAVWVSNSMWLYMLDNQYLISDSKSISISPVVFGIKESVAKKLNLVNKSITNKDILSLIEKKEIKYIMPSVTKTNTGATAYFGFLNSLAGNPDVLTVDILNNQQLLDNLKSFFNGVERVSGDEAFLKEMFINGDEYEAVIADEASLININKELESKSKEPLYLLYPTDGVAINDSALAFISNNKELENDFLTIQNYLLSDDGQKLLLNEGRRTWYGGVNKDAPKNVFKNSWGIDTTKYLSVTRFPSKNIITKGLHTYIEVLRKPAHVIFCLDYSGSMYGDGIEELLNAMDYILDYDTASKDDLQFTSKDKITVITFSNKIKNVFKTSDGKYTSELLKNLHDEEVLGGTALYSAIIEGINILKNESDEYTKTIIAMTDGEVNIGTYNDLKRAYTKAKSSIPVYSITFGDAREDELEEIAALTNAKVFDGKTNLLKAFKEVRGYN